LPDRRCGPASGQTPDIACKSLPYVFARMGLPPRDGRACRQERAAKRPRPRGCVARRACPQAADRRHGKAGRRTGRVHTGANVQRTLGTNSNGPTRRRYRAWSEAPRWRSGSTDALSGGHRGRNAAQDTIRQQGGCASPRRPIPPRRLVCASGHEPRTFPGKRLAVGLWKRDRAARILTRPEATWTGGAEQHPPPEPILPVTDGRASRLPVPPVRRRYPQGCTVRP